MSNQVTVERAKEILKQVMLHGLETGERIPVMLWGPAGVGKSDIVFEATAELPDEYKVTDLRLSSLNPVDVRGMPYRVEDGVRFARPFYFPESNERRNLFLDEINTAPPATQVTAYEIARNYSVGGNPFPQHTLVTMAGNRAKDRGATYSMPKPLENRLLHLDVMYSVPSWLKWASKNDVHPDVMAFIQFRPDLIGSDKPSESSAFPTPRSWSYLSSLMKTSEKTGHGTPSEFAYGLIGSGAATEFEAFVKLKESLPDVNGILENGNSDWTSNKKDIQFAYTAALSSGIKRDSANHRVVNFAKEFNKLPPEMQVIAFWMMREIKNLPVFLAQPGVMQAVKGFASDLA